MGQHSGRGPNNQAADRATRTRAEHPDVGAVSSGPRIVVVLMSPYGGGPVVLWSCGPRIMVVLWYPYSGGPVIQVCYLIENVKKIYFWREPATKEKINMKGNPF